MANTWSIKDAFSTRSQNLFVLTDRWKHRQPASTKGISNGPTQMDRGRSFRSVLDRGQEKPSPTARRILTAPSAAMQTRPKFGRGLRRRGLIALSTGCPLLFLPALLAVVPGSVKFRTRPAENPPPVPMENATAANSAADPSINAADVAVTGSVAATAPTAST
jgi:hypothetical protein